MNKSDQTLVEQPIISPVAVELLEAELTDDALLRRTNKGGNLIYVVDYYTAPNVMREVGRLREIAFRGAGGGTGLSCDIDEFDRMTPPCRQLIVWDPDARQILGGYRYILGKDMRFEKNGAPRIATAHLFNFSKEFIERYIPITIELGRSFVRREYQSSKAGAKALYALDNLWDGLGALIVENPEVKYFFGKVTMYPSYSPECRNMILYFLTKYYADKEGLVTPIEPLETGMNHSELEKLFCGADFAEDYKILNKSIRGYGLNIPPLVNAYMSLSPSMRVFGTAINHEFGAVEETGIFIAFADILEEKKRRHIQSYITGQNKLS